MTDNDWIDPNDGITKNDVLYRPAGVLSLSFPVISVVADTMRYAQVHFTLIDSLLTVGEQDLTKVNEVFCDVSDVTTKHFPTDSLISGKLIVTSLDRNARRVSGNYNFSMRDKDGKVFDVNGQFADQYWLEHARKY
jgi:hypothetical protein